MATPPTPSLPPHAVCVEVVAVRGSAPREVGARMLVRAQDEQGSIGGGHLEWLAMQRARKLLGQWRADPAGMLAQDQTHALGPSLGQCCGGAVTLRYQPWFDDALPSPAPLFHLQLHGAGHVGRALARLLTTLPCQVRWVDVRDDAFPPPEPAQQHAQARIERVAVDSPEAEVALAPPGAFFLVMTHSHALDAQICEAVLRRGDFGFLGLIGSHSKRAGFARRWRQRGLGEAAIASLVCPIGVPGIAGKQPEVIALAAAAQLMQMACRPPSRDAMRIAHQGTETSRDRD
ncbi:MAG: xanthine dehydrogenase accessory protein XdhC [Thiomonas delicata]